MVASLFFATLSCGKWKHRSPSDVYRHARQTFLHGHLQAAGEEADKGYEQFAGREVEWGWRFRLLKADILIRRGFNQQALELLSGPLPSHLADPDLAIKKLALQAVAETRLGRFDESNQALLDAERLCAPGGSKVVFEVKTARGVLELSRNHLDLASGYFRNGLQLARQMGDRFEEAAALVDLAVVALRQEQYAESIDWSNSALVIAQSIDSELHQEKILGNLAWAYYRLGDSAKALSYYDQAIQQAHSLGIERDQTRWSNNLGLALFGLNQLPAAEEKFQQSLTLARNTGDPEQTGIALTSLAFLSVRNGQLNAAQQFAQQALDSARGQNDRPGELYALFALGQIAAGRKDADHAEHIFLDVAQDPQSEVPLRWQAQNALALLYEQQNQLSLADKQYKNALDTLECARDTIQHEEFRLPFLANATHVYDDYLRFLVQQGKTAEALSVADYSRAQTLSEGLGLIKKQKNCGARFSTNMTAQQAARRSGATVLFYWLGDQQSYLWVVTSSRTQIFNLPPAGKIEPMAQSYRDAIVRSRDVLQTASADGMNLYNLLLAPAGKLIARNSRVVIIPDRNLNNLNFETLIVPGDKPHFWIEDATIVNASSLSMLAASRTGSSMSDGKLLLMGNPVSPNPEYPELPKAALEMDNIEKHFSSVRRQVYSREAATSSAYFASRPEKFSYIHFVSHGTASQMNPLDSAVILSRATAEEDSFKLEARNIIGRPVRAELVTISACYGSGTRAYTGEGLVGLSWAFVRAGAHNVIGALWEVNDESTPRLMDDLYAELKKGHSPQDALRSAKLSLLHSDGSARKPVYWATFQLYAGS